MIAQTTPGRLPSQVHPAKRLGVSVISRLLREVYSLLTENVSHNNGLLLWLNQELLSLPETLG